MDQRIEAQVNMPYPVLLHKAKTAGLAFLPNVKRCRRNLCGFIYGIRRKNLKTGQIDLISTTDDLYLEGWALAYMVRGHENGCVLFWADGDDVENPYSEFLGAPNSSDAVPVIRCLHSQEIIDGVHQEGILYLDLHLTP